MRRRYCRHPPRLSRRSCRRYSACGCSWAAAWSSSGWRYWTPPRSSGALGRSCCRWVCQHGGGKAGKMHASYTLHGEPASAVSGNAVALKAIDLKTS